MNTNIRIIGVPEEEQKKKGYEKIFEEIIVDNFPNMEKEIVNQKTKIMASSPITLWQICGGKSENSGRFSGAPKSLQTVTAATKLKDACSLEGKL